VTTTSLAVADPREMAHSSEVSETHWVEAHAVRPTRARGDASCGEKEMPEKVRRFARPVVGPLGVVREEACGAS